jgi:hypothetical protein
MIKTHKYVPNEIIQNKRENIIFKKRRKLIEKLFHKGRSHEIKK